MTTQQIESPPTIQNVLQNPHRIESWIDQVKDQAQNYLAEIMMAQDNRHNYSPQIESEDASSFVPKRKQLSPNEYMSEYLNSSGGIAPEGDN